MVCLACLLKGSRFAGSCHGVRVYGLGFECMVCNIFCLIALDLKLEAQHSKSLAKPCSHKLHARLNLSTRNRNLRSIEDP